MRHNLRNEAARASACSFHVTARFVAGDTAVLVAARDCEAACFRRAKSSKPWLNPGLAQAPACTVPRSRRSFLKSCSVTAAAGPAGAAVVCERQLAAAARTGEAPGPNDRPAIALIGSGAGSEPRKRGQLGRLVAVCDVDAKAAPWRRRSSRRGPAAPKIIPISGNCSSAPISRARPLHHGSLAPAREPRRRAREEGHLSENRSRSPSRRPGVAIPSKRAASCCRPARSRQLARFGSVRTRAQRRIGKLTTADFWLRRAGARPLSESGPEGLNWDYWPGQAPPSIVQQRCHGNFASGMFTRRP